MVTGLDVRNETNNKLQFTTRGTNYGLLAIITVKTTDWDVSNRLIHVGSGGVINYPAVYLEDILAVAIPDGYWIKSIDPVVYRTFYGIVSFPRYLTNIPVNTDVTCYVFRPMKYMTPMLNAGITILNEATNELAFTSSLISLVGNNILNDSNTSITVTDGSKILIADAAAGLERTTDSSGQLIDNMARINRSGNNYNITWSSAVVATGYPASQNYLNYRPSAVMLDIKSLYASFIPGLPAPNKNASTNEFGTAESLSPIQRITAGSSSVTLKMSGTLRCTDTSSTSNSATLNTKWRYRNITTAGAWTDVSGSSRTPSASTTVVKEAGTPDEITYNDNNFSYTDTLSVTNGQVYEFRCVTTYATYTLVKNFFCSVVSDASDPAVVREVLISPTGTMGQNLASFSRVFAAEIYGGVPGTYSWSLTSVSGGSGSLSLTSQTGNQITLNAASLDPQQTKTATINISTTIDGISKSASENIGMKNRLSGATFSDPSNQNETKVANSSSQTFNKTITPTNPYSAPVVYNWFIDSTSGGGSWSISAGQGTATPTFSVSSAPTDVELQANIRCSIVADADSFVRYGSCRFINSPSGIYVSSITPSTDDRSGPGAGVTFSPHTVTVIGGTPSSIVWSFTGQTGPGTFSIASGQGTLTATPQITGVTAGNIANVTLRCTVTIGGTPYVRDCNLNYARD